MQHYSNGVQCSVDAVLELHAEYDVKKTSQRLMHLATRQDGLTHAGNTTIRLFHQQKPGLLYDLRQVGEQSGV